MGKTLPLTKWLEKPVTKPLLETRDRILVDEDISGISSDVVALCALCMLSSAPQTVNRITSALFQLPDVVIQQGRRLVLELFWQSFPPRPENVPWDQWDEEQINDNTEDEDPTCEEFYTTWTKTDWLVKYFGVRINRSYDMHQWKDSADPITHAICARLLCRPVDGVVPEREALEEAFAAVDKLFTELPLIAPDSPHHHIFPLNIYFTLANHLGKHERAIEILQRASSQREFDLPNFLSSPALYQTLARSPKAVENILLSAEDIDQAEDALVTAIEERALKGKQEPLSDVLWPELMRRFSIAAFLENGEEYKEKGIKDPGAILNPPATREEIAEIEKKLGPLPQDLKDMAVVSNGFKGGWQFACGGICSISELVVDPASEHEVDLRIKPEPVQETFTETLEDGTTRDVVKSVIPSPPKPSGVDWGNVYFGPSGVESDSYTYLICPSETWSKIRKGDTKEGEYRVFIHTYWGHNEEWPSLRHWIANLTMKLERDVIVTSLKKLESGGGVESM